MHSFFYPQLNPNSYNTSCEKAFLTLNGNKTVDRKISKYFTDDISVLNYRKHFFSALIRSKELRNALLQLKDIFKTFFDELAYTKQSLYASEPSLRDLLFVRNYINFIRRSAELLSPFSEFGSEALDLIRISFISEAGSEDFIAFEKEVIKYEDRLNNIKSITIGVNLDAQMRPQEAGLVSINDMPFKSGNTIERFLRLEFKRNEYCCIAPLSHMTKESGYSDKLTVDGAVNTAIASVIKFSGGKLFKNAVSIIEKRTYDFIPLKDELNVIGSIIKYIERAEEKKLPLCTAEFSKQGETEISNFYDPTLCKESTKRILTNDIYIKNGVNTVVFTGPNSGGKTVALRGLGLVYLFAVLGIPIPAKKASLGFVPKILQTAFSPDNTSQIKGRLEQECAELGEFIKSFDKNGVIFLDEPFSTTSAEEGAQLLDEFISKVIENENSLIFITTHLHKFAETALEKENVLCCELNNYKIQLNSAATASNAKNISDKYW